MIKGDQLATKGDRVGPGLNRDGSTAWLVESVKVRGRVAGDFADLNVELAIVIKGAGPVWAPIRLDDQKLTGAREGVVDLSLRMVERQEWQVKLTGGGEHRIQVDLRTPVSGGSSAPLERFHSPFRKPPVDQGRAGLFRSRVGHRDWSK